MKLRLSEEFLGKPKHNRRDKNEDISSFQEKNYIPKTRKDCTLTSKAIIRIKFRKHAYVGIFRQEILNNHD